MILNYECHAKTSGGLLWGIHLVVLRFSSASTSIIAKCSHSTCHQWLCQCYRDLEPTDLESQGDQHQTRMCHRKGNNNMIISVCRYGTSAPLLIVMISMLEISAVRSTEKLWNHLSKSSPMPSRRPLLVQFYTRAETR